MCMHIFVNYFIYENYLGPILCKLIYIYIFISGVVTHTEFQHKSVIEMKSIIEIEIKRK